MKKIALIAILMMIVLALSSQVFGVGEQAKAKFDGNKALVHRVLDAIKTRDSGVLEQTMTPGLLKEIKPVLERLWELNPGRDVESFVNEMFGDTNKLAVVFSLNGMDRTCRGVEWSVHFVTVWYFVDGKISDIEGGNKLLKELSQKDVTLSPTLVSNPKARMKATIGDLLTIGNALQAYEKLNKKYPVVGDAKELAKVLAPHYIRMMPLKDQWGNYFIYESKDGKAYCMASGGSDSTFKGFEQKGYWDYQVDKGQDVVLTNKGFVFAPDIEFLKKWSQAKQKGR